jgi:hypothetical protein
MEPKNISALSLKTGGLTTCLSHELRWQQLSEMIDIHSDPIKDDGELISYLISDKTAYQKICSVSLVARMKVTLIDDI